MIEDPGAAGGPLGLSKSCIEIGVHIKTHRARLPLDGVNMKIIGECLAGRQCENGSSVAGAARRAWAVKRAMHRAGLPADILHDVDFATSGPAGGRDVIAKHPESGPHSLPRGNLDARFKATIR